MLGHSHIYNVLASEQRAQRWTSRNCNLYDMHVCLHNGSEREALRKQNAVVPGLLEGILVFYDVSYYDPHNNRT